MLPEQSTSTKPDTLYRGVVIPASEFDLDAVLGDLSPGVEPIIDGEGRKTVYDGNEYGVYMSTNPRVAKVYASSDTGEIIKESPRYSSPHRGQFQVTVPRVGIEYTINTDGLDVRRPYIKPVWSGHYNNGFIGDEYIADVVPSANHQITGLRLGYDSLHRSMDFSLEDGLESAVEALKVELSLRMGRLALFSDELEAMPADKRLNPFAAKELMDKLKSTYPLS